MKLLADMVIGDGCIITRYVNTKYPSFKVAHSAKQTEYAEYKANRLNELGIETRKHISSTGVITITTKGIKELVDIRQMLYYGKTKILSDRYMRMIDAESLAIIFMDDGSKNTVNRYKVREWDYYYDEPFIKQYRIALCNFTVGEVEKFSGFLSAKFNISSRVLVSNTYPYIIITTTEAKNRFRDLIYPYVIPSMRYKLDGKISRRGISFRKVLYSDACNDYQKTTNTVS